MTGHDRGRGARWRLRRRAEDGYVAVLTAMLLASGVFVGLAAVSVDVSNWYSEMEKVQRAADAAALAGVPFLPQDLPSAVQRAKEVAARNGFDDDLAGVEVKVERGDPSTQLHVTISARTDNDFGGMFGADSATITRQAVADYQGPAPMGSPCNTFGNEPSPGGGGSSATPDSVKGTPFPNCTSRTPQFWANIEGPETGKVQGDRYQTKRCEDSGVDGCTWSRDNEEYDEFGYVFVVSVEEAAKNTNVTLQLYDPAFVNTGQRCNLLPSSSDFGNNSNNTNPYVKNNDARLRYSRDGVSPTDSTHTFARYCNGDSFPGASPNTVPTTSFVLRQQTDTQNPQEATVQNSTSGSPCIAQYGGRTRSSGVRDRWFKESDGEYDELMAQTFHNWSDFCTFRPTRAGNYYLQVRTNVTMGGTCTGDSGEVRICRGNSNAAATTGNTTTGGGSNSFAIRAKTQSGRERDVAVSGYNHMPIFVNSDQATSTFNLIRVLPGAAGQFIRFSYFDAGDAQGSGYVKVKRPLDATGSILTTPFPGNCRSFGGSAGGSETSPVTLSNCTAPFEKQSYYSSTSKNNGKVQTIDIPVPGDYTCEYTSPGGCWYQVEVNFGTGTVNDVTTWDAAIIGDPVRLVE